MRNEILKIGTRGSKLALIQSEIVQARLQSAHPGLETEIVKITTSGDWKPQDGENRLSEIDGGKGLFAREIEQALLAGDIDIAVHSLKDMPSFLPDGLTIAHVLEREDPRDAFISPTHKTLSDLPQGAIVGTSSLRRQALILALRPDVQIVPLRGNVGTRLEKVKNGQADATFLAVAGLNRLSMEDQITSVMSVEDMLPAAAQGIVAIECRKEARDIQALLDKIHHRETGLCAVAERAVLQVLDGSCHTPIGAYAVLQDDEMFLRALVASEDGTQIFQDECRSTCRTTAQALEIGQRVGQALKQVVPPDLLT